MASSSSAIISKERAYDVFLSFRGEDIRSTFISHLYEALCRNQILTFIDYRLERGDNISPSLFNAIEGSIISVIIFSENYADSKWCLKELTKILQCRGLNGQIVIPVFYGVDPSDIRKQTGKFGVAFDKLKERLQEGEMDLNVVRSHLVEAANISGWNSQDISCETELIKSIVGDVLNKFNRMTLNLPSSLVGIGLHVERVETLLCLESPQFCIVGLWGMGGIGKTTIARAVFKHICSRFDSFHFVENVSNELRIQSVDGLREKIVLKLFEEERRNMGNRTLQHGFKMKQFERKKVLIVLDDVDDAIKAMKLLFGENDHLFSEGSRILVTSRDKQVLKNIVGGQNLIYEVGGLNEEESLQLFSLTAFRQNHPTSDRLELTTKVLSYARGNPLALVVLGHALFDKSTEEWHSTLDELGEEPFPDIQRVLRISYDALCDEEKMIFVDIASFLVGKTWDSVVGYYKECVKRIEHKVSKLIHRSLITISKDKRLGMHDLLKEMGRAFESTKKLEKRTRIWDLKDVYKKRKITSQSIFLKAKIFNWFYDTSCDHQGSSMIEAISVDLSQGERISEFDCSVLSRLDGLKFLELHRPTDRESKVRFYWKGFRGFPDEIRYLRWDAYPHKSLPSKFSVENLVELHMPHSKIRELWTGKPNIVNLKVINLKGAINLVEFPDVSEGKNIQQINLAGCTSLVKLSSSVQHLPKLEYFSLLNGPIVENGPTVFDSKVLVTLWLCRGFKTFPQFASVNNIKVLCLDDTDIREVPSSVELLKGLKYMYIVECKKLSIISTNICKLKSLLRLDFEDCTNLESFPKIIEPMESLTWLNLRGCTKLKWLPNSFHNLKSLTHLYLGDTAIVELPSSIQYLICLEVLYISRCQNLTSLPSSIFNLRNLRKIYADRCFSLKTISSACFASESKIRLLDFANCLNWDSEERGSVLNTAFSYLSQRSLGFEERFKIVMPWSEIPQWFGCNQSVGSSLTLKLPMDDDLCYYAFAFCVLIKPNYGLYNSNRMDWYVVDDDANELLGTGCLFFGLSSDVEHLLLWYSREDNERLRKYFGQEISLQFRDSKGEVEVTKCGVLIFPVEDTGNAS